MVSAPGFRFASEAAQHLRVSGHFLGQEFEGDKATEIYILGLVDYSHPAAQLLQDAIVRDGLADEGTLADCVACHWGRVPLPLMLKS